MPDSRVSFEEETRVLRDAAEILRQAANIKSAELEALTREVSEELKDKVMSDFISCVQKKMKAVRDYKQAWDEEKKIREAFSAKGLSEKYLPFIDWPGIAPSNFIHQEKALQHRLEQMDLGHILG